MRVVSLVPSVTESLLAWGVRPVAVTRFCDVPDIPAVGGTKTPDISAIVALEPDLVVMEREENRREDANALTELGVRVHALHIRALEDVAVQMAGLAEAVGLPPAQGSACGPGRAHPSVRHALQVGPTRAVGEVGARRAIRAWVPIWRRPWMSIAGGTYATSLLARAGIINVFTGHDGPYPTVGPDEAGALRADVVLAPSEPYPFKERHKRELESVAPVELVDGRDLFWWGARTPAALDRLRALARRLDVG